MGKKYVILKDQVFFLEPYKTSTYIRSINRNNLIAFTRYSKVFQHVTDMKVSNLSLEVTGGGDTVKRVQGPTFFTFHIVIFHVLKRLLSTRILFFLVVARFYIPCIAEIGIFPNCDRFFVSTY